MRRGVAKKLLEPHNRNPRLGAVDPERVPEIVYCGVGLGTPEGLRPPSWSWAVRQGRGEKGDVLHGSH